MARRQVTSAIKGHDAVIVGAGPAGLTAAIYLGRFRRPALVLDSGESRLGWIPISHNHPGFPGGVAGAALLSRMKRQAEAFGATIAGATVRSISREGEAFALDLDEGVATGRFVILATGVEDRAPPFPDLFEAVQRGLIRMCPICDAYEAIDKAIAVIGAGEHGVREALFLRRYSDRVTLLLPGGSSLDEKGRSALGEAGVPVIEVEMAQITVDGARVVAGGKAAFDTAYLAFGLTTRTRLATDMGAKVNDAGCLIIDAHQHTTVDGLYAAGDVVRGLNQISIAQAEGAIAATDIHNRLLALS